MCFFYGYAAYKDNIVNTEIIRSLAAIGEHNRSAWGVSVMKVPGVIETHRSPGRCNIDKLLDIVSGSIGVVGHFRTATSGPPSDNNNNQPIPYDQFSFAHTGCTNSGIYESIYKKLGGDSVFQGKCDSEIFAAQIRKLSEETGRPPEDCLGHVIESSLNKRLASSGAFLLLTKSGKLAGNDWGWSVHKSINEKSGVYMATSAPRRTGWVPCKPSACATVLADPPKVGADTAAEYINDLASSLRFGTATTDTIRSIPW